MKCCKLIVFWGSMERYRKAYDYIIDRMGRELPPGYYYHNVDHVLDVLQAVTTIAELELVGPADTELLQVAALYHDSGFVVSDADHERMGCNITGEYLPTIGYTTEEISTIRHLIMATHVPHAPASHLEQIMCDADLDYLGRDDFFSTGHRMFLEMQALGKVRDEQEWNELQLKFLIAHRYFTATSKRLRQEKKMRHLDMVRELVQG